MKCVRWLLVSVFLVCSITGCVQTVNGKKDPLATTDGRKAAIQAYIDLAMGYARQGMTEQAKAPLQDALKLNPHDANANAALAYIFQLESEDKAADIYYQKALDSAPQDSRILNNYGVFLFSNNQYQQAKMIFIKASADNFYSERSMVFENLGLVSLRLNNTKDAEDYFQRSLRLNVMRPVPFLELARLYYNQGDYQRAKQAFENFNNLVGNQQGANSLSLAVDIYTAVNDKDKALYYKAMLSSRYPNIQQGK